jgi:hypothetical protein
MSALSLIPYVGDIGQFIKGFATAGEAATFAGRVAAGARAARTAAAAGNAGRLVRNSEEAA